MTRSGLPFRPATGVVTYDRLETSDLTPVAGALQTADFGIIVEQPSSSTVSTFSPGGPRFAVWTARTARRLRLRGLSSSGSDGSTRRGVAMIIGPNTPTTWEAPDGSPGAVIVSIEPHRIEHILQSSAFSAPPDWACLENVHDRTIRQIALLLETEISRPEGADSLIVSSLVCALTAHALRSYSTAPRGSGADAKPSAPLPTWRLRRVRDYIAAHIAEPLSLSDLAKTVGLSTSQFSRAFKAATGASPHAYVVAERVSMARRLLCESDLAIAEIAFRSGFASQAHLTSTFTQYLGTTPANVRRMHRAQSIS